MAEHLLNKAKSVEDVEKSVILPGRSQVDTGGLKAYEPSSVTTNFEPKLCDRCVIFYLYSEHFIFDFSLAINHFRNT